MEIIREESPAGPIFRLNGRLDAAWGPQVSNAISEAIREGAHHLTLHMAQVTYLSSAGIRVLFQAFKQLKAIKGELRVTEPSKQVREILDMAGLGDLMPAPGTEEEPVAAPAPAAGKAATPAGAKAAAPTAPAPIPLSELKPVRESSDENRSWQVYELSKGNGFTGHVVGTPGMLSDRGVDARDSRKLPYSGTTMGLGLGALGNDFDEARERYGEFLAVGGAAVVLPADRAAVPDYEVATASLVPNLNVVYGLHAEGEFTHQLRLETKREKRALPLSEIVNDVFTLMETNAPAIVLGMLMETQCLVGASLRRSPATTTATVSATTGIFGYPEVRDWLSLTTERAFLGTMCLVVGIAMRHEAGATNKATFLRPLKKGGVRGHFHAAVFGYRPIRKGCLELNPFVQELLDSQTLQSLQHLLNDEREIVGVGESEFTRGAIWAAPLHVVKS